MLSLLATELAPSASELLQNVREGTLEALLQGVMHPEEAVLLCLLLRLLQGSNCPVRHTLHVSCAVTEQLQCFSCRGMELLQ